MGSVQNDRSSAGTSLADMAVTFIGFVEHSRTAVGNMIKRTLRLAAAIAMLPAMAGAQGLQYLGPISSTNGGLGSRLTVLTLNNTNNISSGCISPPDESTCGNDYADNTVQQSSQIRLLSELGTQGDLATDLRILGNFSEGTDNDATVTNLTVYLYNAAGAQVAEVHLFPLLTPGAIDIANVEPGIGNAGFGFSLTAAGRTAFNAGLVAGAVSIGLGASLSDVQAGQETFSVARLNSTTSVVPEPSTYALMAAGLAGIFIARRRRNRA
jgi:hypothetical protein